MLHCIQCSSENFANNFRSSHFISNPEKKNNFFNYILYKIVCNSLQTSKKSLQIGKFIMFSLYLKYHWGIKIIKEEETKKNELKKLYFCIFINSHKTSLCVKHNFHHYISLWFLFANKMKIETNLISAL